MIRVLFTDSTYRDLLKHFLMMVRPGVFGAVARLNRYCWSAASALKDDKQSQWLEAIPTHYRDCFNLQFIHNGWRHGEWRYFYDDGRFSSGGHYVNDKKHGDWVSVSADKKSIMYETYHYGVLNGTHVVCDDAGSVRVNNYVNGKLHGDYRRYVDGRLVELCPYRKGHMHGRHNVWYPRGALRYQRDYRLGRAVSDEFCWFANGNIHQRVALGGELIEEWYDNGHLKWRIRILGFSYHGEHRLYGADGRLLSIYIYKNDVKVRQTDIAPPEPHP